MDRHAIKGRFWNGLDIKPGIALMIPVIIERLQAPAAVVFGHMPEGDKYDVIAPGL
jgi:hypothetical protein